MKSNQHYQVPDTQWRHTGHRKGRCAVSYTHWENCMYIFADTLSSKLTRFVIILYKLHTANYTQVDNITKQLGTVMWNAFYFRQHITAPSMYCREKSPLILSHSKFSFVLSTQPRHAYTDNGWQGMLGVVLRVLRNHPEDDCDSHQVAATHNSNPRTLSSLGPTVVVTRLTGWRHIREWWRARDTTSSTLATHK